MLSAFFIMVACDIETTINSVNKSDAGLQPTFTSIEEKVFRPRCALSGCHDTASKNANLDLSTANAFSNLVGVQSLLSSQGLKRVEPGNSSQSFLIKVLDGSDPTQMPLNGAPLSDSTVTVIAEWINKGAMNN